MIRIVKSFFGLGFGVEKFTMSEDYGKGKSYHALKTYRALLIKVFIGPIIISGTLKLKEIKNKTL